MVGTHETSDTHHGRDEAVVRSLLNRGGGRGALLGGLALEHGEEASAGSGLGDGRGRAGRGGERNGVAVACGSAAQSGGLRIAIAIYRAKRGRAARAERWVD